MLFTKIKEDRMTHLGSNSVAFGILGLVISEVQRTNLQLDVPDKVVVRILEKLEESINQSLEIANKHNADKSQDSKIAKLQMELQTILPYMPAKLQQLTESELTQILTELFSDNPVLKTDKGALFKVLREKYDGRYDGKLVNKISGTL